MSRIGCLFSGQGSQYIGMTQDLYNEIPESKEVFNIAADILKRSISSLCFRGAQEELNITTNTQPCVLTADLAAYAALSTYNIKPFAMAGFSLGEYAALVCSKVISIEESFEMIKIRAESMQNAVPIGQGGMVALQGVDIATANELCSLIDGYIAPANYNCPGQIVVSGEISAISEILVAAKSKKIRAIKLPVSAAFHCELMHLASETFGRYLAAKTLKDPIYPVYMNVDAQPITSSQGVIEKMVLQIKSPVYWEDTIRNMHKAGVDTFIEFGPGCTLTSFVKKTLNDVKVFNVESIETLEKVVKELKL